MTDGVNVTRIRIGDALLAQGLINDGQLQIALAEQKRAHRPLGEILISLGFVRSDQVAQTIADGIGVDFLRAKEVAPDPVLVEALDPAFVRATQAFPIRLDAGTLEVAVVDPMDPEKISAIRQVFPYPLRISMITDVDLAVLSRRYLTGNDAEVQRILIETEDIADAEDYPVERLTAAILSDGVNRGATDVHIQPEEKLTRVRYRIDGVLQSGENLPREVTEAVISRIKVLSRLDIAERRRPQDGRLRHEMGDRRIDMRVSIMPNVYGENAVLRILDRTGGAPRLAQLGIGADRFKVLKMICEQPHGLFLVTGPTGSGKTTTLYSMLGEVDAISRNVATIEDPVEYPMPLVRQSEVDTAMGYGFHQGLRALLRQDPDVVLVGEIRDEETASMAIKASMTGHLVFATLHTNDAIGALPRLVDLGIPPYLVEDAIVGVLAQRLVRKVCDSCGEEVEPSFTDRVWLGGDVGAIRSGTGCEQCGQTGLAGRTVITELFMPTDKTSEALRVGDVAEVTRLAKEQGFQSLEDDGRSKVRQGVTTMAEVLRVSRSKQMWDE